jgi:acetyltransferase-like isoleucine patch superfamily enzyme
VHIGPGAEIAGLGGVFIGDYAAVGSNAQVLSHSEALDGGKRLSGPMIPEEIKGMKTAPVRLEKDSFVGAGAVILPGITLGEGAVVAANSLVTADVKPWQVVMGVPARPVGRREPVQVPEF